MRQVMDVSGAVLQSEREYDIAANTNVSVGALVKLNKGQVEAASAAATGALLGITAEAHTGVEDALNPRNNGTKIIVRDAPGAIFACPAPVLAGKTGGNATTVKFKGASGVGANAYDGGFIKDKTGAIRRISATAETTGDVTLTVDTGSTVGDGEPFVFFPPVGCTLLGLNTGATNVDATKTGATSVKVVGRDTANNEIWVMAAKHVLGNDQ